ncbi:MAG: 3-dehydroquinate synthase [Deltaproteobacteria bacterium]|nr:3-dehydroquinate synthase [Deltaproteobacteria bacterium]
MRTLPVELPGREYQIEIGVGNLQKSLVSFIRLLDPELVVTVTNTTLEQLYPGKIRNLLDPEGFSNETCVLPDGESFKNLETLQVIYDFLMEKKANRGTVMVAFGGGVIGDMAGFAAATFMRGIRMIQVPTTLLAQVDSSVGGKTAVNHPLGKNTIGAFKQPNHVSMDLELLKTLPSRELQAGFFELAKHGLIHDRDLFDFLNQNQLEPLDLDFLEEAVFRSCRVKARIVEQDETETGLIATLNFGHTLGHLIETHSGYGNCLHGEAVGTGMLFASYLSWREKLLGLSSWEMIRSFLEPKMRPVSLPPLDFEKFCSLLLHDKKASREAVNFILLRDLGDCFIQKEMPLELIWNHFGLFCSEFPDLCRVKLL